MNNCLLSGYVIGDYICDRKETNDENEMAIKTI